ncbi:MAG TPA: hypothetical protein VLK34_04745, partial [Nocardioidaceae bacterium]|nr:hypothetical protein [Nocardioidaceae bacterium]
MAVDLAWRDAVRAACDPVFASADVDFRWNGHSDFGVGSAPTLLWEADPLQFAARYPDGRIEESYGEGWPAPCIDYWVYIDPVSMTARLNVEGWGGPDPVVELTGDGVVDGQLLAAAFAEILR